MIVISGALVLVALVLLIFGITTTDLDFVYASIVVSLVSFVFLLVGILQRRGDRGAEAPAASGGEQADQKPAAAEPREVDEGVTAVVPRSRGRAASSRDSARTQEPVADPETEEIVFEEEELDEELAGGTVLVVPGRPRYHVAGCRYLTGKSATEVDVLDARDEGFSPCGVCKPDDALAAEPEEEFVDEEEPALEEEPYEPEPAVEEQPEPVAAAAPARRARTTTGPRRAPAKRSPRPTRSEPSTAAAAAAATADPPTDPVLAAVATDQTPAAGADGPAAAPASGRRTGNVVVIPDRGKFHRAECRYVRNAEETSTMSRTRATRQGYDACGVCKP